DQACPVTGTTSECPDSIQPATSSGPTVANRFALPGSSPCCTKQRKPASSRYCAAQSMSEMFGFVLTVSKATSLRSSSTLERATAICLSGRRKQVHPPVLIALRDELRVQVAVEGFGAALAAPAAVLDAAERRLGDRLPEMVDVD